METYRIDDRHVVGNIILPGKHGIHEPQPFEGPKIPDPYFCLADDTVFDHSAPFCPFEQGGIRCPPVPPVKEGDVGNADIRDPTLPNDQDLVCLAA